MKVQALIDALEKAQPEADVYIRKDDGGVYTEMGVSYDDIGDVEIYETA